MKKQVFSLLAAGALFAFASNGNAGEVRQLTDNQMDAVSAGSVAIANAAGLGLGEAIGTTVSLTSTFVQSIASQGRPPIVVAQAYNQSAAAGGFLFQAAAVSHADSFASWLNPPAP